jgi:peptide/nickel transport system permease protein
MARMKGIPERLIVRRHALPNALIPAVQAAALMLVWLMGGVVIIEFLFNFPGLGTTLTGAVSTRDVPVVQAVTLIFAFAIVLFNVVADALTTFLSPRLRTAGR